MDNQHSAGNSTISGLMLVGRADAMKVSMIELVKRVDSRPNSFRVCSDLSMPRGELWSRKGLIQLLLFSRNIYDHSGVYLLLRHQRTVASSFPTGSHQRFQGALSLHS